MLGDSKLAEYLDGGLEDEALTRFEEMAADDDSAIAQIVAQQRIHQALQILRLGEKAGHQAGSDRKMKRAIMEAACGKELGKAAGVSRSKLLMKSEPGLLAAAIWFLLMALLAVSFWFFAPHP